MGGKGGGGGGGGDDSDDLAYTVLLFAAARDAVGADRVVVKLAGTDGTATVRAVVDRLMREYPPLQSLNGSVAVAVNLEFTAVDSNDPVRPADEIALIPPISGG